MVFLTDGGAAIQWGTDAHSKAIPHVREHGIQQFLNVFKNKKDLHGMPFLWGEEVEHQLIQIHDNTVTLSTESEMVINKLRARPDSCAVWNFEYGSFMVESTPDHPYNLSVESLDSVQDNIARRYDMLNKEAPPGVVGTTFVTFPLMGQGNFVHCSSKSSPYSQSLFVPDACINQTHPRFANLTANIRLRRGQKVCILVPLYMDTRTMENTVDPRLNIDLTPRNNDIFYSMRENGRNTTDELYAETDAFAAPLVPRSSIDPREDYPATETLRQLFTPATLRYYAQYFTEEHREHMQELYNACPCPVPLVSHPCIYMDCMAFGMGSSALQVTMQLDNIHEARHVYDQLAILCPAFLALSSATPFQKGLLCDTDVRWLTIAGAVDDRRAEEVPRILKSRYDSISVFISDRTENLEEFNDSHIEVNRSYCELLKDSGVDVRLANHIAHLFIRDPLVMYDKMIDIDDTTHTEHFDNIQSTNWQTMRFKPPPIGSDIGWRVEFRVMDIQPTPFENAAFAVFIPLLTKAIVNYKPCFYTKISIVEENMSRAHRINPCGEQYVMRKDIFANKCTASDEETARMSIDEIFNGKEDGFYGLIPLVCRYLDSEGKRSPLINSYLKLLSMRASGSIPTPAQYMRRFVTTHPDYKHDSRLTDSIARDLVQHMHSLASNQIHDDDYLPMSIFRVDSVESTK
ncbi:putative gamma-glutamylcysteine synthetase [Leishmania mexicana MHOM/GT/2001/U1103]|uniref:Glutamate--cysteine ligase n=1 Tax=Leishmania mexicana (strain MHOM/GT/2001/U1103) TaxID=929439 RepID=E9ARV1_LEIMU|nr:putative gamma-glutamylcysteine synthetase [Leishmania mexicana MHOM/GT/2001/U1103]CBZ25672.1 putative gamma-glutamylcysteine synthetase [Leishmania mexicana MHOM/GT/2001/U1103]